MEIVYNAKKDSINAERKLEVMQKLKEVFLGRRVNKCLRKQAEGYSRPNSAGQALPPPEMQSQPPQGWQTSELPKPEAEDLSQLMAETRNYRDD